MKHKFLNKLLFLTLLTFGGMIANPAWAEVKTLTFVQTSSSAGNLTGAIPSDVTATFSNTYTTKDQLTNGNTMTLTISGWATTTTIKGVTLEVKNNKSSGNGTATVTIGETVLGTLSITGLGSTYQEKAVSITETQTTDDLVITIECPSGKSNNSVYCDKFIISYEEADSSDPSSEATFANTAPSISYPATKTYSQAPTTAVGYTGTISYEITANTAGATINATTGLVTVTQGGSVTVKANAPAVTGFSSSTATYTLTVTDTRTSAGLAWSAASASVTYDDDSNEFPTLTNTHNVAITYSSTNTTAATIDAATGVITLNDVTATTSISATFAGDDDYLPQTVSYTLNVTKGPFKVKDGVFDFVSAGAEDEDYGSEESPTSSSTYYNESETTWTAGNVKMVVSGKYRWWSKDMTLRLYNTNTSPASAATFSVPVGYVITKIETTGGSFVSASVGKIAAGTGTWTGFAQSVKLSISTSTVNFKTINVTYAPGTMVSDAGFTTYVTPEAIEFTGVTAYIATSVGTNVTLSSVASAPANTPVVIESSEGTYTFTSTATPASVSGNLLQASDGSVNGDGSTIYALGVGKTGANEGKVGFYLVGSDVQVPAGKAYLEVGAGAKEFLTFDFDDEATSIEETLSNSPIKGENIYNLAGQRLQKMQKGINIVNGKKILK